MPRGKELFREEEPGAGDDQLFPQQPDWYVTYEEREQQRAARSAQTLRAELDRQQALGEQVLSDPRAANVYRQQALTRAEYGALGAAAGGGLGARAVLGAGGGYEQPISASGQYGMAEEMRRQQLAGRIASQQAEFRRQQALLLLQERLGSDRGGLQSAGLQALIARSNAERNRELQNLILAGGSATGAGLSAYFDGESQRNQWSTPDEED